MSLKTLIEAAEYVGKGEASEEPNFTNQITATSASTLPSSRKMSGEGTIQHWRKRAVAQSVMELNKCTDEQSPNYQYHLKDHLESTSNGICDGMITNDDDNSSIEWPVSFGDNNKGASQISTASNEVESNSDTNSSLRIDTVHSSGTESGNQRIVPFDSECVGYSMNSEDAATPSANAHPRQSPISTPTRKSVASSPHGTMMLTDPVPQSPRLPNGPSNSNIRNGMPGDEPAWPDPSCPTASEAARKRNGSVTREAHNQLEKSRRKHLKECYERLRSSIQSLGPKVSHLTILREALQCIKALEPKRHKLEEIRQELSEEKEIKQGKVEDLKQQLSNYMSPTEINSLLMKACQKVADKGATEMDSTLVNIPDVSGYLKQFIDKPTNNVAINNQECRAYNTFGLVETNNVFPPLSSTMNLVVRSVNEARRICTMLPTPRILTSPAIINSSGSITTRDRPLHYSPTIDGQSLSHFKPCSVSSSHSNVKSYTGWTVPGGGSFMQEHPLKIVVKQVGSAKQQARVTKSYSNSEYSGLETTNAKALASKPENSDGQHAGSNFHRHPSVTPPMSNVNQRFPRFSIGSAGSPPLTTKHSNLEEESQAEIVEATGDAILPLNEFRSQCRRPRSKSDIEDLFSGEDDELLYSPPKKRKSNSSSETFPSKSSKKNTRLNRNSFPRPSRQMGCNKSPSHDVVTDSVAKSNGIDPPNSVKKTSMAYLVPSPVVVPSLVNQSKSITQVCFTTLNMTKPAIPSNAFLSKQPQTSSNSSITSKEVQSVSNLHLPPKSTSTVTKNNINMVPVMQNAPQNMYPMAQNMVAMTMAQNMVPVMMPVLASPSMGIMMQAKPVQTYVNASTKPTVTTAAQAMSFLPNSNSNEAKAGSSNQTYNMRPAMPQFQCMVPMGFPSMMAGPNGATMMMQPSMSGYVPMMSQGQGWGFMMPQNMMMAPSNKNCFMMATPAATTSKTSENNSSQPVISASDSAVVTSSSAAVTTTTENHAIPPATTSTSKEEQKCDVAVCTAPVQQQHFQMMPTALQNAGQYMVPIATPAAQTNGFIFGGAPTMIPAQGQPLGYQMPMNFIGYPMQFGGSSPFQFAMPNTAINVPSSGITMVTGSAGAKLTASGSQPVTSEQGTDGNNNKAL